MRRGWGRERGFAVRSQFLLSSNDLLLLRGCPAPAGIYCLCRTVHGSRKFARCTMSPDLLPGWEEIQKAQEGGCGEVARRRPVLGPWLLVALLAAGASGRRRRILRL